MIDEQKSIKETEVVEWKPADGSAIQIASENKPVKQQPSFDELQKIGQIMFQSGMFPDTKSAAQAVVKIMAGRELGLGAFASMSAINIIKGNISLSANLLASKVKASKTYDYAVKELSDTGCALTFFQIWEGKPKRLGESKFDQTDANRAGLLSKDNWMNYPRAMYFARALSSGVKLYCPDIFFGMTVYTEDEIEFVESEYKAETSKTVPGKLKEEDQSAPLERPYDPEIIQKQIKKLAESKYVNAKSSQEQKNLMIGVLETCFASGDTTIKRHEACTYLTGHGSSKNIPAPYVWAMLDWLKPTRDDGGAYMAAEFCDVEAEMILLKRLEESGQGELPISE